MGHKGLIVAAPFTGSGKTTVTLGLLKALAMRGLKVAPAKVGPDYIDPQFHQEACGRQSINLDSWAMRPALLEALIDETANGADLTLVEGVMGLFDGAYRTGHSRIGSTADIAKLTGWPVILVVNCARLNQSVAALIHGFQSFDPDVPVRGVILNNVASERHKAMLLSALEKAGICALGTLPRQQSLHLPSRHLGLVQAEEQETLSAVLDQLADIMEAHSDMDALINLAGPLIQTTPSAKPVMNLKPPGQRVAIAADAAFRFRYEHILSGWRKSGAELNFFSPLCNEAPCLDADAIYLPGGYPELHASKLAAASNFKDGLRKAAQKGQPIFGECGGYMVLGNAIIDQDGVRHEMAQLLNLETSFESAKLHIGYRHAIAADNFALGSTGERFRAHEFHHAVILSEVGEALFSGADDDEIYGLRSGSVSGSFLHLIDRDD